MAISPVTPSNAYGSAQAQTTGTSSQQQKVELNASILQANQDPDESDAAVQEKFMAVIGEGIDRGFSEAKTILSGLNVLQGSIADNIDQTYSLVQDGLKAFKAQFADQSA